MPHADCTALVNSTSRGSRYVRPMSRKRAPQVSSVSASTVATKSRISSCARDEADGAGARCTGGEVGASPLQDDARVEAEEHREQQQDDRPDAAACYEPTAQTAAILDVVALSSAQAHGAPPFWRCPVQTARPL